MKRSWNEVDHQVDSLTTMANCLVLLSQGRELSFPSPYNQDHSIINSPSNRVFECKTCNRQFPSFQALGGHRASHKKSRLLGGEGGLDQAQSPAKPKTHECLICGLEFSIGQALGGHMRRHRTTMNDQSHQTFQAPLSPDQDKPSRVVVKKSNSRRVFGLDLNLTPFENDLELLRLGKAAPMVDCFF